MVTRAVCHYMQLIQYISLILKVTFNEYIIDFVDIYELRFG